MPLYEQRNIDLLDRAGGFHNTHLRGLANEPLSEREIAAELGYRELLIERLMSTLKQYSGDEIRLEDLFFESRGFEAFDPNNHSLNNGEMVDVVTNEDLIFYKAEFLAEDSHFFDRFQTQSSLCNFACLEKTEVKMIRINRD